jgi:regulator of RNase E activity RraA
LSLSSTWPAAFTWMRSSDSAGRVMYRQHGDLVHADRHGAVVIPADVAAGIPAAVELLVRKERAILDVARAPGFSIDALRAALKAADEIH